MTSVNTNAAALTALRTLQNTNSQLESVQSRISTGLKIGEAKDNAAYWSIATTLKSDNKSLSTVKDALSLGSATVDTAYQGLNKAKDVLDEIKSKLTAATQDGVDRSKIQSEITELQKQLTSIASSSTFSGENWLSVDSSVASYNASKSVVSSFSRDASGAVSIGSIDVNITNVKLFDKSGSADGILDGKSTLKAGNTTLTVGGLPGTDGPSAAALNFSGTATGSAGNLASGAKVELGTLNMAGVTRGDVINFTLNVDGHSNTVRLKTDDLAANGSDFAAQLQAAVNTAMGGSGVATVKVGNSTTGTSGVITIEAAASEGTSSSVSVGQINVTDGDGVVTDTAGILGASSLPGPSFGTATKASATLGTLAAQAKAIQNTAFTAGSTTNANELITFDVTWGDQTRSVSVDLGAAGSKDAATVSGLMQTAINTAFTANGGTTYLGRTYVNGDIVVASDMSKIETLATGGSQKVTISNVAGAGATSLVFSAATATAGTGANFRSGDQVAFNVQYGSSVKQISYTFQPSDISGWATPGKPTAEEWKDFLQTKIDAAFRGNGVSPTSGGTGTHFNGDATKALYANGDLVVKNTGGVISIESKLAGKDQAVGLTDYALTINGSVALTGNPSRFGLTPDSAASSPSTNNGKVGYGNATAPTQVIGTFSDANLKANDRISMTVNVGGSQKTITVSTDGMVPYVSGTSTAGNAATFQTKVQNALDSAFGANVVTFTAIDANNGNNMTLKTVATGTTAYLAISNVTTQDGNNSQSNPAGLTAGVGNTGITRNGQDVASAATAVLTSGTAYTSPITVGANDAITINLSVDNVAKTVVIDRARVDAALGAGQNGVIANVGAFVSVLNSAFGNPSNTVAVTASAAGNNLVLTRNGGPAAGSLQVTSVTSATGANLMSVDKIDVSDAALTTAGVTSANRKDVFAAYISLVNDAINKVTTAAASLGSVASRIDMQKNFVNTLMDTIEKGVGNLVDADMTEESTKLQALQVKSQLGVQSLSIANQSAQSVLSLFRG